jgi:hypothetical protein
MKTQKSQKRGSVMHKVWIEAALNGGWSPVGADK